MPAEVIVSIAFFNNPSPPVPPMVVDMSALLQNLHVTLLDGQRDLGATVRWVPPRRSDAGNLRGASRARKPVVGRIEQGGSTPILPRGPAVVSFAIVDPQTPQERAAAARRFVLLAMRQGHLEEAEAHFRRVADILPGEPGVPYNLGDVFLRRGKYREAIDCLERLMPTIRHGLSAVPQMLADA